MFVGILPMLSVFIVLYITGVRFRSYPENRLSMATNKYYIGIMYLLGWNEILYAAVGS